MTRETARNVIAPMIAALVGGFVVSGINALSRRDTDARSQDPIAVELALESAPIVAPPTVQPVSGAETVGQVAALESRIRELEAAEQARESASSAPEPTPEEAEARAEALDQRLTELSIVEPLDSEWTDRARATVDLVLESEGGPPVRVEELRCTTSLCRVVCAHDMEDANAQLHQQMAFQGIGEALSRRVARPEGGYETHLFFAREGQYLPADDGDGA